MLEARPVNGRKLKPEDVKTVPTVFTSNPTLKKVGTTTIAFASGAVGVQKLLLTGKALDPVDFVAYPGFEAQAAKGTETTIQYKIAARFMRGDFFEYTPASWSSPETTSRVFANGAGQGHTELPSGLRRFPGLRRFLCVRCVFPQH